MQLFAGPVPHLDEMRLENGEPARVSLRGEALADDRPAHGRVMGEELGDPLGPRVGLRPLRRRW